MSGKGAVTATVHDGPLAGEDRVVYSGPGFFWLGADDRLIANAASLHPAEILDAKGLYVLHEIAKPGQAKRHVLVFRKLPGQARLVALVDTLIEAAQGGGNVDAIRRQLINGFQFTTERGAR